MAAIRAGFVYVLIVFSAGFALGTLRVMVMAPAIGEWGALLVELPVMLGLSWFVSGLCIAWFAVPSGIAARLLMGLVAFGLLMAAEANVAIFAFGRTMAEHWASFQEPRAQWGLAAQIAFAAMPLIRLGIGKT